MTRPETGMQPSGHRLAPRDGRTSATVSILGIRGLPPAHGGFETFAARLAPWLADRGWEVRVYSQSETGKGPASWCGVELVQIASRGNGPFSTVKFDLRSTLHAARQAPLVLTLGYNTALFNAAYRLSGVVNIVNMDGLEWRRRKWSWPVRQWFRGNEQIAMRLADHMVADNPAIAARLERFASADRISMIPYGADPVDYADPRLLDGLGLQPKRYVTHIARIEQENQTLEIVEAFSRRRRGVTLALLGALAPPHGNAYHDAVRRAAGPEVRLLGAIYDKEAVASLRRYSLLHYHGHTVGGTNPSLVEALAAGNPVLAHGNVFNRWVAGPAQCYFSTVDEIDALLGELLPASPQLERMGEAAARRHAEAFQWEPILRDYERLLIRKSFR